MRYFVAVLHVGLFSAAAFGQAEPVAPGAGGQAAGGQADVGFVSIFDGQSLDNWDGDMRFWSVEDNAITGITTKENPTKSNTFLIWRGGDVGNFELKLQYRVFTGNSGIQYRSFPDPEAEGVAGKAGDTKWRVGGYQADIESQDRYSGILYDERSRGILATCGQRTKIGADSKPELIETFAEHADIQAKIRSEDWNDYHITADGFRFVHRINGVKTIECSDEDEAKRRASGILALQIHRGPPMKVQFRNIRIKRPANE